MVGLLLLVIPGLVALTLLAVVGPIIEIEHQKVAAAMRRSTRLTRSHPWTVILLATVPLAVAGRARGDSRRAAPRWRHRPVPGDPRLAEGVAEACIAVILVELCFRLMAAHTAAAAPDTSPDTSPDTEAGRAARPSGDGSVAGLPPRDQW